MSRNLLPAVARTETLRRRWGYPPSMDWGPWAKEPMLSTNPLCWKSFRGGLRCSLVCCKLYESQGFIKEVKSGTPEVLNFQRSFDSPVQLTYNLTEVPNQPTERFAHCAASFNGAQQCLVEKLVFLNYLSYWSSL